MTSYKLKNLYKKILYARDYRIRFVFLPHFADITEDGQMRINLHKNSPPLRSYIHEMLHYLYPSMSHKDVYTFESELWKYLSHRRKLKLYRKLFSFKGRKAINR